MSADSEKDEKKIGYKCPPANRRFEPGRSGNPKGRPKGAKSFATAIEAELNGQIAVTENGKRKKISKRVAITKQLINKAASGCLKSIPIVLNETRDIEGEKGSGGGNASPPTPEDTNVMESILRRLRMADEARNAQPREMPPDQPQDNPTDTPERAGGG